LPAKPHAPLDAQKVAQLHAAAQRRPELPEFSWHDDPSTFDGSSLRIRNPTAAPPKPAKKVVLVESNPHTYDEKRAGRGANSAAPGRGCSEDLMERYLDRQEARPWSVDPLFDLRAKSPLIGITEN
jgi:hypothetical protein